MAPTGRPLAGTGATACVAATNGATASATQARQRPERERRQPAWLVAVAAGGLIMPRGKPLTQEVLLRGAAARQAKADAFARTMARTIAALEREGITVSTAMAKTLNELGVATPRSRRWDHKTVIALRRRLRRLGPKPPLDSLDGF